MAAFVELYAGALDGDGGGGQCPVLNLKVVFFCVFLIIYFTSYFLFSITVLPHSTGVVYYHLLLRRETRIPGVASFSFRIRIWLNR